MNKLSAVIIASVLILFSQLSSAAIPYRDVDGKPYPSLAPMLKVINPAVVNISTYSTHRQNINPLLNDPFFRHFFNIPDQPRQQQSRPKKRQQSAGSGVIVNASDGIVMTNYHVIKNSQEIKVSLTDGRNYNASLVGVDPDLDIAILQVDADNLTQVQLADSNQLEVGDFVVAIGNPFGLGQTVTTGVVSALGRSGLGIEGYENFIQTDASINPGNSGGALVNLAGQLVGINTAIIAPSGGNIGIGFAIPANMAKASMEQIIANGEVQRGQLGISIHNITPDLHQAFNLKNGQLGVLVTDVVKDSPADKSGILPGDIILKADKKIIRSAGQLRSSIGIKNIGDKVKLTLLRDGDEKQLIVKIGDPQMITLNEQRFNPLLEGVEFENTRNNRGVVVTALNDNSPAAYNGLKVGDIVTAANRQQVYNLQSLNQAVGMKDKLLVLQIKRGGRSLFVIIR
ncbi:DegQ family serine endoprotease [Psychromonas ossibalaenae]|uniref:DegQ family serine endoprotease n=1 Tax=Psychromonas ossibalaenae TaxID=444922 RepID=UPI000364A36A|nr:DegQ family serine endoprotease [Psychromonas ossibalaenae]